MSAILKFFSGFAFKERQAGRKAGKRIFEKILILFSSFPQF